MRCKLKPLELRTIHPSSFVSSNAKVGRDVTIGANVIIYDNVEIGDGTVVGPGSILGEPLAAYYRDSEYTNPPLVVGPGSIIRSGSILYAGSTLGAAFESGHRATIREFSQIGSHCRVGSQSEIQGYCRIGNYDRIHGHVRIAQKTTIGDYVWIYPFTIFTNDWYPPSNDIVGAAVEDFAVVATSSVVMAGVRIGKEALVGAMSLVRSDVAPGAVVVGNPARQIGTVREIRSKRSGERMYPWQERFDRDMPWEGQEYADWVGRR